MTGTNARIQCRILAVLLVVSGCEALFQPTPAPPTGVSEQTHSVAVETYLGPASTPDPCLEPLRRLGNASQLMADQLTSIREPLTAKTYDGWAALAKARAANATLGLYAQVIPALEPCAQAAKITARMADLGTAAHQHIAIVIAAGFAASAGSRAAMVALFELLPEVLAIASEAQDLADERSLDIQIAASVDGSTEPLGPLAALPTPRATPKPATVLAIRAGFFGSGIALETYRVSGATPNEIIASMNRRGPVSDWIGGRAAGLTAGRLSVRIGTGTNTDGSCYLFPTNDPGIVIRQVVTLPKWSPPSGVSTSTVDWWNDAVRDIAVHERHHVEVFREGAEDMNAAMATATCGSYFGVITEVWAEIGREQCEFDMKEYGYARGLSLEACVSG